MSVNGGRGNTIAATEGKDVVESTPPPLSSEIKEAVAKGVDSVHTAGQDAGAASNGPAGVELPPGQGAQQRQPAEGDN